MLQFPTDTTGAQHDWYLGRSGENHVSDTSLQKYFEESTQGAQIHM